MPRSRSTLYGLLCLTVVLLAGCANYDASQAEQVPPLGTPPAVTLSGPAEVTRPDSLHVVAHVAPGELEFADYNFGCTAGGEVIQSRVTRVLADRIDLEATLLFTQHGSYWVWVHVWDAEEQTDTDSLAVTIR